MAQCLESGCSLPTYARGLCARAYKRLYQRVKWGKLTWQMAEETKACLPISLIKLGNEPISPNNVKCRYLGTYEHIPFWFGVCRQHRSEIIALVAAGETTIEELEQAGRLDQNWKSPK